MGPTHLPSPDPDQELPVLQSPENDLLKEPFVQIINLPETGARIVLLDGRLEIPGFIDTFLDGKLKNIRRQVNFYPDDQPPTIVIGAEEQIHSDVHLRYRSFCNSSQSAAQFAPERVAGFFEEGKFTVRVEGYVRNEGGGSYSDAQLEEINRARHLKIFQALNEAHGAWTSHSNWEVEINNDEALYLTKTLGELHRIEPAFVMNFQRAQKSLKKNLRTLGDAGDFYYAPRGTRYKTPVQMKDDLLNVSHDRSLILKRINSMLGLLSLERTNISGTPEARFLVLSDNGVLDESPIVQGRLYRRLERLYDTLARISDDVWSSSAQQVNCEIGLFVGAFDAETAERFQGADLNNAQYVIAIARNLRSEANSQKIARGISTPQVGIEFGKFDSGTFVFAPSVSESMRQIGEKVLSEFGPQLHSPPTYFCLGRPISSLTQERHSAAFLKDHGRVLDESFVFYLGNREEEIRFVVRRNPLGRSHWESLPNTHPMRKNYNPEKLSEALVKIRELQVDLFNGLLASDTKRLNSHSHPVPAFRPFHKVGEEEYLGRPFIEGGRLDLVSRWDLNFAQLLRYAAGLGEVYAVNLQALRVVEDHEILVTAEALGRPKKLESIGTWEAFFNNSGANTAEELFELLTPFYGAALAGWLASAEFGKFGSTRTIEGVQQVKAQMVEVFKRAFCLRFEGSRYQWDEVRDGTLQSYLARAL